MHLDGTRHQFSAHSKCVNSIHAQTPEGQHAKCRAAGLRFLAFRNIVPLKGAYGGLIIIYPKPYSIYLRGTVRCRSL